MNIDTIIILICLSLFLIIFVALWLSHQDSEIQDNYLRDYHKDDDHYD